MNEVQEKPLESASLSPEEVCSVSMVGWNHMEVGILGCGTDEWLVKRAVRYYLKIFSPPPSEVSGTGSRRLFQRMGNLEAGIRQVVKSKLNWITGVFLLFFSIRIHTSDMLKTYFPKFSLVYFQWWMCQYSIDLNEQWVTEGSLSIEVKMTHMYQICYCFSYSCFSHWKQPKPKQCIKCLLPMSERHWKIEIEEKRLSFSFPLYWKVHYK